MIVGRNDDQHVLEFHGAWANEALHIFHRVNAPELYEFRGWDKIRREWLCLTRSEFFQVNLA